MFNAQKLVTDSITDKYDNDFDQAIDEMLDTSRTQAEPL